MSKEYKEAIEYLETIKKDQFKEFGYINQAIPIVIALLKRGEAYRKIVKEFEEHLNKFPPGLSSDFLIFTKLKRKYLKEAKQTDNN